MLGRIHFTGNDGYQKFLHPILSSLILDSNEEVTNWTLIRISCEKIKPLENNFEFTMPYLNNGRVILTFNNSILVPKSFPSLSSIFTLNLYIVSELNEWPKSPTCIFL